MHIVSISEMRLIGIIGIVEEKVFKTIVFYCRKIKSPTLFAPACGGALVARPVAVAGPGAC